MSRQPERPDRWDGDSWSWAGGSDPYSAPTDLWGTGAGEIWSVSPIGGLRHWDGRQWTALQVPTSQRLTAVSGRAADDVWAVGSGGTLIHWDGVAAHEVASPTLADLRDVWGNSQQLWIAGDRDTVFVWDGAAWRSRPTGTGEGISAIRARGPGHVVAVGSSGAILCAPR